MKGIRKYGLEWDARRSPLQIELTMIRRGGQWEEAGVTVGEGLYHHYREAVRLLWPEDDQHRWTDLLLRKFLDNEISVVMGSSDSGKSYGVGKFVLVDWWAFPECTLWLLSSTELRGAELRIWGAIKQLFNRGRARARWLPGVVLESRHAITTEEVSDDGSEARLLTKGLIFVPCKQGNQWVGLGPWIGVKPVRSGNRDGRLGHVGDECQLMAPSFLGAYANWYGKPNFRGILLGNPSDLEDPLCQAAEPVEGWENWQDTGKTQEWRSKFYGAAVVALDGRDSPNNDQEETNGRPRFPYLVGRKKLEAVGKTHGVDSWQYFNQCIGKPRAMGTVRRVISRQLCENNRAFEDVIWEGSDTVKVGFLDAAYGGVGGDRCMAGHLEFGRDVEGKSVIAVHPLVLVPVSVRHQETPELQIATFMKDYCATLSIPPENFFFDGRGTLAVELARVWSPSVNVVDFGGPATKRPVSAEEFVWDGDVQGRRLKRCDEHYSKFVTELWFTVYYLVVGQQLRQMPRDAAAEGYKREWKYTKGNRIEVEPKSDMKKRTNQSPDAMDSVVTGIEGARRLGFLVENMRSDRALLRSEPDDWLERELTEHRRRMRKGQLKYA